MANNYGKKWEKKFAADFSKVPGSMVTNQFQTYQTLYVTYTHTYII